MAITNSHGKQKVASNPLPKGGMNLNKSKPSVVSGKGKIQRLSAGKNQADTRSVKTGTFHGMHDVAHATKGSAYATKSIKAGSAKQMLGDAAC